MTKQEAQAFVKYNDDIKNHRWASKPQTTQNKSVADIIPNLVAVFIMILNYKSVTKYRHTRYSSLFRVTYADEMYLAAADAILAVNDQLEKQLREIKADHSGRLRLGISVQRSMQILPKVIPVFRQKYPKVTLDLTERGSASLEELLQKGAIDLVFVAMESTGTNLVYEQLIEQETISILDARDTGIVARIESGPPITLADVERDFCADAGRAFHPGSAGQALLSLWLSSQDTAGDKHFGGGQAGGGCLRCLYADVQYLYR